MDDNYLLNKEVKKIKMIEGVVFWSCILIVVLFTFVFVDNPVSVLFTMVPFLFGLLVHHYIFLPAFFFKSKYPIYGFLVLVLVLAMAFFSETIRELASSSTRFRSFGGSTLQSSMLGSVIISVVVLGINLAIGMVFGSIVGKMKTQEDDRMLTKRKMEFLMFQISPHFLMNTLNNIHALVDVDVEKAKEAIVSLSRMLRYMLYETAPEDKVPLHRQMEVYNAYCDLHMLRYGNNVKLKTTIPKDIPNVSLPPLIFIVFLENAFKHGIAYGKEATITTNLWVENNFLHYSLTNTIVSNKPKQEGGGVGLVNVKKRLDICYGDTYTLNMGEKDGEYHVHLILPI